MTTEFHRAPPDVNLERVLNSLEKSISTLHEELRAVDNKMDDFIQKAITKDEFDQHRAVIRTVSMWGAGLLVTIIIAAVTIILSRPNIIVGG
jgi:uncharacterized protein YlxW (UPF0749 family)